MLVVHSKQRTRQRRRHDVREVATVFCALLVSVVVGLLVGLPVVQSEDGIRSKDTSGKGELPEGNDFDFATHNSASMDQMFMNWCKQVLGIETILEIQTFTYYDYMTSLIEREESDYDDDDDDDYFEVRDHHTSKQQFSDPPPISVRGLAATRDIAVGEIVISTPLHALVTISTTIDQDPVLSRVMGPQARRRRGWILTPFSNSSGNNSGEDDYFEDASNELYRDYDDDDDESRSPAFYELPLLAVSLLYHRQLGTGSPLYPYIQILLRSPTQSMPFLWSKSQRRSVGHGVRVVAKSIRQEMIEMYKVVVQPLIQEHPDVFGKPQLNGTSWAFSYPNFQWAFAMVNSRHWELPIDDLETDNDDTIFNNPTGPSEPLSPTLDLDNMEGEQTPPAAMPTDAWIQKEQSENNVHSRDSHKSPTSPKNPPKPIRHWVQPHSFLAPVADLLNFGPPCTRGEYNPAKHSFDIVASCPFTKGQEVTFWYSSECEHIIIGNYGFTHPMVPKCPTKEDYQEQEEIWKRRAEHLVDELSRVYKELDQMQRMFQNDCDCPCNPNDVNRNAHNVGGDDDGVALGVDDDEPPTRVRGSSHHFNPNQQDVDSLGDHHKRRRIVDEADIERQKIRRERRSAL